MDQESVEQRSCIKGGKATLNAMDALRDAGQLTSQTQLGPLVDFLSLVLDNVYSGLIVFDANCRIIYVNRVYAELLSIDPKSAVGEPLDKFFPYTRMPKVLSSGRPELGQRCSLKTELPMMVNRIPLKIEGKVVGGILQTIFRDYKAMTDLMSRFKNLENEVKFYKKGLDQVLSARYSFDSIIGQSPAMAGIKEAARKYAQTHAPVLITGATGTGKEMFAHAVHTASKRTSQPFVCVNCAAIPRELLESELFGYESGAFTGASKKGKVGQIQLAHKGTLFLDEIGELSTKAQVKLLRVLETKMLERLGGVKPVPVDFRLVAATNRDLKEMMARGEFRDDLYYRLSTMTVRIPPLCEREGDLVLLADHFLRVLEHPDMRISAEVMDIFSSYSWPGNVRELKNVIERAVSLADKNLIEAAHLPRELLRDGNAQERVLGKPDTLLSDEMARHEKAVLERALGLNQSNMSKTSKKLGISRTTLYEKCRRYGLLDKD